MNNQLEKIWIVELSLLEKLKEICKKHDLTYYASCGTLLGTVRHKGFIPWDDDMDLFLLWPDYQKLMEVAPKECEYPYFFQSIYTEKDAMPSACRLRRSDTTGFTRWEDENVGPAYDRGIFIDIFPLFYVPDSDEDRAKQKKQVIGTWECIRGFDAIMQKKRGGHVNKEYESYIPKYLDFCERNKIENPDEFNIVILKKAYLEACASEMNRTKELGATSSKCHQPNLMWNTEWYDHIVELPFENTTISCPADYEKVLEKQYGDWRTPVRGGALHEMVIIDAETPWRKSIFESKMIW
jgi:lipopolysaccharide cholinephosphotransferase